MFWISARLFPNSKKKGKTFQLPLTFLSCVYCTKGKSFRSLFSTWKKKNKVGLGPRAPRNRRPGEVSSFQPEEGTEAEGEHAGGRSVDVSAHGEVDEDEDVELDEDGDAEEDGIQDEAGQAQPPVQGPLV